MSTDDSLGTRYDVRRQARGVEPPDQEKTWWHRLIIPAVAVLVLGLLIGGYFTYTSIVYVKAVRAYLDAGVREISSAEPGTVVELPVQEGDPVSKDQVLIGLEDSSRRAALEAARAAEAERESLLTQAKINCARVSRRVETAIERARTQVRMAKARVASAEAALESRKGEVASRVAEAKAQCEKAKAELARLKKGPREEDIFAAEARLASARAQLDLYELEVKQSEQLVGEGIDSEHILEVRKTRLKRQRSTVREAELALRKMKKGPTAEEIQIARQEVRAREAAVDLARATEKDVERLRAELEARKSELTDAEAALREAQDGREEDVQLAEARRRAAASALDGAENARKQAESALEDRRLRSPIDGVVTRIFPELGELADKLTPLALVQKKGHDFYVHAWVAERDAPYVKVGQKAWIEVLAGTQGYVESKVTQVSYHTVAAEEAGGPTQQTAGQSVWCKIVPTEPLEEDLDLKRHLTARAVIRVR